MSPTKEELGKVLLQQQKLASLGMLSAGIAHEIQNPLNFVINFSKMSEKLIDDLKEVLNDVREHIPEDDANELDDITTDLNVNLQKIREHGERAVSIIQGILLISRGKEGECIPTDIAHLLHEYVWLAYHAQRASDKSFNISITESYQEDMPHIMVVPQDLSRAVLNVVNNACYAVTEKAATAGEDYKPTISVVAKLDGNDLIISIADNGCGVTDEVRNKLFHETITTKPIGKGTGLGMIITHDIIVNEHHGRIDIDTKLNEGTTFTFVIPTKGK
ncbi:MAG: GHKL domain-containing protein [Prevotella sp.]|nr:GHKL domain-containing protein [Prevotella sp.]